MTTPVERGFAVTFASVDRWDPMSYHRIEWHWPTSVMVAIGSVLRTRKEPVDRAKFDFSELQPITIHLDGSIDRRTIKGNREYSMALTFACPGDIVVAKIDLKNGAVGLLPEWQHVVVTGHFAVYEPDRSRLVPEYFVRLIQVPFFRSYLWRNKVGAEGRKEVKLDFFESISIPLPPLATQRAILAQWQKARKAITEAKDKAKEIEAEMEGQFFAELGLKVPRPHSHPKTFGVTWLEFDRWSVSYNQAALTRMDLSRGKFPVVCLSSLLSFLQYGTSTKANTREQGVPVIRMNNIVDGTLDLSALKHVELGERERAVLVLDDGDILVNRTNSKELVGKCAPFHQKGEYVFASYIIRVRVRPDVANPDYIVHVLNSGIGRQQIDAMSRQIIGQANINSTELRSLQIPLPPLVFQDRIMGRISAGRARIAAERDSGAELARRIENDMEAYLLGTKRVPTS